MGITWWIININIHPIVHLTETVDSRQSRLQSIDGDAIIHGTWNMDHGSWIIEMVWWLIGHDMILPLIPWIRIWCLSVSSRINDQINDQSGVSGRSCLIITLITLIITIYSSFVFYSYRIILAITVSRTVSPNGIIIKSSPLHSLLSAVGFWLLLSVVELVRLSSVTVTVTVCGSLCLFQLPTVFALLKQSPPSQTHPHAVTSIHPSPSSIIHPVIPPLPIASYEYYIIIFILVIWPWSILSHL